MAFVGLGCGWFLEVAMRSLGYVIPVVCWVALWMFSGYARSLNRARVSAGAGHDRLSR